MLLCILNKKYIIMEKNFLNNERAGLVKIPEENHNTREHQMVKSTLLGSDLVEGDVINLSNLSAMQDKVPTAQLIDAAQSFGKVIKSEFDDSLLIQSKGMGSKRSDPIKTDATYTVWREN